MASCHVERSVATAPVEGTLVKYCSAGSVMEVAPSAPSSYTEAMSAATSLVEIPDTVDSTATSAELVAKSVTLVAIADSLKQTLRQQCTYWRYRPNRLTMSA